MRDKCSISGCKNVHHAKGFCKKHYERFRIQGDPLYIDPKFHGMYFTPEYRSWRKMKERCNNKNHKYYKNYGGRGISVCKEWNDFMAFYKDMGDKPFPNADIDRIDNNGDYEPSNCRWVSRAENCHNKSTNKLTIEDVREIRNTFDDKLHTRVSFGKKYGVSGSLIGSILSNKVWVEYERN